MDSRKIIKILKQNGWYEIAKVGSHTQFRHPERKGRVTVPHPQKKHADWHIKKHRAPVRYQTQLRCYHGKLYCYRS